MDEVRLKNIFFLILVIKLNNNETNTNKQKYFLRTNYLLLSKLERYPATAKNQKPRFFRISISFFQLLCKLYLLYKSHSIFNETRRPQHRDMIYNCVQSRISHWANQANARGLALLWASRMNIKALHSVSFMFLGCSPHVKVAELLDYCV